MLARTCGRAALCVLPLIAACNSQVKIDQLIKEDRLLEACRVFEHNSNVMNEQRPTDLSEEAFLARLDGLLGLELGLQALSGPALGESLRLDPFDRGIADSALLWDRTPTRFPGIVPVQERLLLTLHLRQRPRPGLRVVTSGAPRIESLPSGGGSALAAWSPQDPARDFFSLVPRTPSGSTLSSGFGLMVDLFTRAATAGVLDFNARGSSQSLLKDVTTRYSPSAQAAAQAALQAAAQGPDLGAWRARRVTAALVEGCKEAPGASCRATHYYRANLLRAERVSLWLTYQIERGDDRCTLLRSVELPLAPGGEIDARINALFADGPRPLEALAKLPDAPATAPAAPASPPSAARADAGCEDACARLGHCLARPDPAAPAEPPSCAPRAEADCRASRRCAQLGFCRLLGAPGPAYCLPDEASCQASAACKAHGWCSPEVNPRYRWIARCRPATAEHCAASEDCRVAGACALPAEGAGDTCRPATAEQCRASEHCREYGWCSLAGGRCAAGADADCAASRRCKAWGLCAHRDGDCAPAS